MAKVRLHQVNNTIKLKKKIVSMTDLSKHFKLQNNSLR